MQATYPQADADQPASRKGTLLSVAGLLAWLSALLLAIGGPLLGLAVPPMAIVGVIVISAAFSVLSLPGLIGSDRHDDHGPDGPR